MELTYQSTRGLRLARKIFPKVHEAEITLRPKELLDLEGERAGTSIKVLDGNVWVTQVNDNEDYVIAAGKCFTIDRPGKVIVQGLPAGKVLIK